VLLDMLTERRYRMNSIGAVAAHPIRRCAPGGEVSFRDDGRAPHITVPISTGLPSIFGIFLLLEFFHFALPLTF
jgi:hypothetical protein